MKKKENKIEFIESQSSVYTSSFNLQVNWFKWRSRAETWSNAGHDHNLNKEMLFLMILHQEMLEGLSFIKDWSIIVFEFVELNYYLR